MELLLQYAWMLASRTKRYHYGGDDPIQGFDCSGFVQELLMAVGEIPFGTPKMNAQMLYERYRKYQILVPKTGSLVFFGPSTSNVDHVGFCLNDRLMLEAGGGDSQTVNDSEAIRRNAFIKMRPILYRRNYLGAFQPPYSQ